MHPGEDHFISCSLDDTVRIWDLNTANAVGKLNISHPYLAAFDPSANVIAIASPSAQAILLYDYRNFDKEPFAVFDILQHGDFLGMEKIAQNWSKLQFSNDGKSLLLGTNGDGHYLLDAFNGSLKSYLSIGGDRKSSARLCAGGENASGERKLETSGDVCFSPDGRYVLGGVRKENIVVWDVHQPFQDKALKPIHELPQRSEAGVLEYNPRFNMLASADKEVVFWHPDRDAALS
jgi:COMPASS component SWD2